MNFSRKDRQFNVFCFVQEELTCCSDAHFGVAGRAQAVNGSLDLYFVLKSLLSPKVLSTVLHAQGIIAEHCKTLSCKVEKAFC